MARIRTVKPEFFTSEDICALTPLARLLYIGTWLEADREGRLEWKPKTLKTRYLPNDECDIRVLCTELIAQGLVVLYRDGLAYIPTFLEHQFINPREGKSKLPEPTKEEVEHACRTRPDACVHAPSLPSFPFPSLPGGGVGGTSLITSPAEYARKREFCAFVGSRLEVPKGLHAELRKALGGADPEKELQDWYLSVNALAEQDTWRIPHGKEFYPWLKALYGLKFPAPRLDSHAQQEAEQLARLQAVERGERRR